MKKCYFSKQKQPFRSVLRKRRSENMQQIFRRTPMPKCDFIKLLCDFIEITLLHGCSPVNLLHIFRAPFYKNTSEWLLLLIKTIIPAVLDKMLSWEYFTAIFLQFSWKTVKICLLSGRLVTRLQFQAFQRFLKIFLQFLRS